MEIIKLKDYNRIYAVASLPDEYKKLFGKSQTEYKKCLKKLKTNLRILDQTEFKHALTTYQQFEKLENENLYSIRYVSQSNPRVLFCLVSESGIVLLSACKEKDSSDYESAKLRAKERVKEMEEMTND